MPFYSLQQFLGSKGTAREWDAEAGQWIIRRSADVRPGMTLRLWQKQGGYDPESGWTGNAADVPPVEQSARAPVPDKLSADGASEGHAWLSLADHTADVSAETMELVQAFELEDKPEGVALCQAAPWHDVGKASGRWKTAIEQFLAALRAKVGECLQQEANRRVQSLLDQFAALLAIPGEEPWAKFPDIKWLLNHPDVPPERRRELRRRLYTSFQPRFRHEAASAMVAWKAWQEGAASSLSGLAVYLIASHHGKVRTVLRSTQGTDAVFGIFEGEELPPVDGLLPASTVIPTEPRRFGASGEWDDEAERFVVESTSWVSMVADLLDGLHPDTLGHYLAALGLLAAVGQRWPDARGCWRGQRFLLLHESLTAQQVKEHLLDAWHPTPYERWWGDVQKADTKAKSSSAVWRLRNSRSVQEVQILECHLVGLGRNQFNPVFGAGGTLGQRDFADVWCECLKKARPAAKPVKEVAEASAKPATPPKKKSKARLILQRYGTLPRGGVIRIVAPAVQLEVTHDPCANRSPGTGVR